MPFATDSSAFNPGHETAGFSILKPRAKHWFRNRVSQSTFTGWCHLRSLSRKPATLSAQFAHIEYYDNIIRVKRRITQLYEEHRPMRFTDGNKFHSVRVLRRQFHIFTPPDYIPT